jgi:long-chain acyl-CoA synthetase
LKALGTRKYLGAHIPSFGRGTRPVKIFGETIWKTYEDLDADANAFGRGLRALGVEPLPLAKSQACTEGFEQLFGPHCCILYEETCAEWTTAAVGCMANSIPIATSYATLGMAALAEVINECQAHAVVCNYQNVAKVLTLVPTCPTLRVIVYTRHHVDPAAPPLNETTGAGANKLVVLSFGDVIAKGAAASLLELPLKFDPTPNHLAVIMYTSGTTGKPKGVMICHSALVSSIAAFCDYFKAVPNMSFPNERYIAYLPLAHIYEFCTEMGILVLGASIGYADPATLTCKGAIRKLPDGQSNHKDEGPFPAGALREFSPTVMNGVPKVWDLMVKATEAAVGTLFETWLSFVSSLKELLLTCLGKANRVSRALFAAAFAGRSAALMQGRSSPLCSALLSKSRQVLGGRLKLAVSGGGPLNADVQSFVRVAFNVPVVQGYGLTETSACGTTQDPVHIEVSVNYFFTA